MLKKLVFFIVIIYLLLFPPRNIINLILETELISKLYIKIFPIKEEFKICSRLEQKISNIVGGNRDNYSITVTDKDGNIIVDINGDKPRIPASNQKLITTAFALDKLGPNNTLNTKLYNPEKGKYYIIGNGNPDLSFKEINIIVDKIIDTLPYKFNKNVYIGFYEISKEYWWPSSWSDYDKSNTYGSPVTRIAINSNSNVVSLNNPTKYLKQLFIRDLEYFGLTPQFEIINPNEFTNDQNSNLILTIKSAPIYALISLANSESHNFTAEVLLRNSLKNWSLIQDSNKILNWLRYKRVPVEEFVIVDGSGLSRENRVTSLGLVKLLQSMDKHKYSNFYFSSFSLYGIRGTLKNSPYSKNLDSKFYGKTGTLGGVRSISGILRKQKDEKLFVSVISNGIYQSTPKIESILDAIAINKCLINN